MGYKVPSMMELFEEMVRDVFQGKLTEGQLDDLRNVFFSGAKSIMIEPSPERQKEVNKYMHDIIVRCEAEERAAQKESYEP